jgi:hypothetical protein
MVTLRAYQLQSLAFMLATEALVAPLVGRLGRERGI